eukprot:CAMPEP_0171287490 /NCGR_PEP_ID=MMETSP0790-20130122/69581_1 /TAXON_ID=2925 /ORGANISM="Alexandrium catenella, Strain OF101" /LENGTH=81 /DNA_ID=CAMNT_0011757019 /DNA_START=194 /DNA_END=436 /DNA_ORIENTATION=+
MVVRVVRVALAGLQVEVPNSAERILEQQRGAHCGREPRPGQPLPHLLLRVLGRPLDLEEDLPVDFGPGVPELPAAAGLHEE